MLTEEQVACLEHWPDFSNEEYKFERFGYSSETNNERTREEALIQAPGVGGNGEPWNWNCAHSFCLFSIAMTVLFFFIAFIASRESKQINQASIAFCWGHWFPLWSKSHFSCYE